MTRRGSGGRALRRFAVVVLAVTALLVAISPVARAQDGGNGETAGDLIGVYVTSLHDFNTADDTFGVDFWVWGVHPAGNDPLNRIEFVNAEQIETRLEETTRRGDREWSRFKARAIVLHDWDVGSFPFDRQILAIDLGVADSDAGSYGVDRAGSGYARHIAPNGWRVAGFDVERRTVASATDFGDPGSSGNSAREHLFVSITLERESVVGFFKLVAGVYAAISIALLSFLMATDQPTVFSGRMAVLVGSLFATVVSLQVSNTVLGSLEGVSLVDKIHIVALVYVLAAAVMAVVSRRGYASGRGDRARRRDAISLFAFGASFLVINIVLILQAAASG